MMSPRSRRRKRASRVKACSSAIYDALAGTLGGRTPAVVSLVTLLEVVTSVMVMMWW